MGRVDAMLAIFCLRLACGLIGSLLLFAPTLVNPRFYRAHFLTALGITAAATVFLWDSASPWLIGTLGAALVLSGESVSGILTERDVLRAVATGPVEGTHVAAWMTRDPETVDAAESTGQAAAVMIHGGFRHLPVMDGGHPVGIVSIRDLMRVVVDDESPRGV